jgi:hypothetical protein
MSFAWVSYYKLSDEEFKQMVLDRRAKQKNANLSAKAE